MHTLTRRRALYVVLVVAHVAAAQDGLNLITFQDGALVPPQAGGDGSTVYDGTSDMHLREWPIAGNLYNTGGEPCLMLGQFRADEDDDTRILIDFDYGKLAKGLQNNGATIQSVTLELYHEVDGWGYDAATATPSQTIDVFRASTEFNEGTGDGDGYEGRPAMYPESCWEWQTFAMGTGKEQWRTGSDPSHSAENWSFALDADTSFDASSPSGWYAFDVTSAYLANGSDLQPGHEGFVLLSRNDNENLFQDGSSGGGHLQFHSSENNSGLVPRLVFAVTGLTRSWQTDKGGWHTGDNWDHGVPTGEFDAYIDNGGRATVTQNAEADGLYVSDGVLNVYGRTLLTILDTWSAYIGCSGGDGSVTLGIYATWTNKGDLYVGHDGTGELSIANGADVSNGAGLIAWESGSSGSAEVRGSGSRWHCSDSLDVGRMGIGELTIAEGAEVANSAHANIGTFPDGNGTVTVDGAGSTWSSGSWLDVGQEGTGQLTIRNGAVVSCAMSTIARDSGSQGQVLVDGADSSWTMPGFLTVGGTGNASLTISGGGAVTNGGDAVIGISNQASGSATVEGADSSWTSLGHLMVGQYCAASLTISDGGAVSNTHAHVGCYRDGTGTVSVTGDSSTWDASGRLTVAGAGTATMTVDDGATVTSSEGVIGRDSIASGVVTVQGAGSQWVNSGSLHVGGLTGPSGGEATLEIADGGSVHVGEKLWIGRGGKLVLDGGDLVFDEDHPEIHNDGTIHVKSGVVDLRNARIESSSVTAGWGGASHWRAGLTCGILPGAFNTSDGNPGTEGIQLSPMASEDRALQNYCTYVYTGQFYDDDGNVSFYENFDDSVLLIIDGMEVMRHEQGPGTDEWRTPHATGNLELGGTGRWYTFELRLGQGYGASGPPPDMALGFGYDPTGQADTTDESLYTHPRPRPWVYDLFQTRDRRPVLTGHIQVDAGATLHVGNRPDVGNITVQGALHIQEPRPGEGSELQINRGAELVIDGGKLELDDGWPAPRIYNYGTIHVKSGMADLSHVDISGTTVSVPIPTDGLLVHYDFDDGTGTTAADSSGNGHDGQVRGAAWESGKFGGALRFDGSGDDVLDDDAAEYLDGLYGMTISMWIKSDETDTDRGFVSFQDPGQSEAGSFRYDREGVQGGGNNGVKGGLTTTEGDHVVESAGGVQTTDWQHFAMVWNSGEPIQYYFDGEADVPSWLTNPVGGWLTAIDKLLIGKGAMDIDGSSWSGLIDEFRIYGRALGAEEILAVKDLSPLEGGDIVVDEGATLRARQLTSQHDLTVNGRLEIDYTSASVFSRIFDTLEGHGTVVCDQEIRVWDDARVLARGGTLTIDAELSCIGRLETESGAALLARGLVHHSGEVLNAGTLASYNGDLLLAGQAVTNTGTLSNSPHTTLFVSPATLDHTGSVEAHSGGGVNFDRPITNHAGQTITLYGGGVAAPEITNAGGATLAGTGTITADLTNLGTTDFFGTVQVFGSVRNEEGAHIGLRNGDLLITGATRNEGSIKVLNGQAYFEGGYSGEKGTLHIDPALAVVCGDMHVGRGGIVTTDEASTLQLLGDFRNHSTQKSTFDLSLGTLQFHGQGEQLMEAAGADIGADLAAWVENFAIGRFVIEPGSLVRLDDLSDNQRDGSDAEAVYVDELVIKPYGRIVLDGISLYYLRGGDPTTDGVPKKLFHGDFDLDGDVDARDYIALKRNVGTVEGAGWLHGDTDGDGDVDRGDFRELRGNFGSRTDLLAPADGHAIPEPATLGLLALGAVRALRRRRRKANRTS